MSDKGSEWKYINDWEALVSACKKHPLEADFPTIHKIVDKLNLKTGETNYAFDIQPVVNGITPPNVAPYYKHEGEWKQPIKVESVGPVIQAVLDKLPQSVKTGQDERYAVHQIRLDDYNSWDHMMGTTTLLTVFLEDKEDLDNCYFLPGDQDSMTNWEALKGMHAEHFPQLEAGK